jgi:8-oxo-dGTP pyrophosphatase MutT (NUDIX family)
MARPATTVLLIRDGDEGLEVLMVVRRNGLSQYAAAMAFPGGGIDPEDEDEAWLPLCVGAEELDPAERARRIAGYRELHEETGILLLDRPVAVLPAPGAGFIDVVGGTGGRLDLSSMLPFAHWVTPEGPPRRYDTFFRLCWLTTDLVANADGDETVAAEWVRPEVALALGKAGERNVLIPTRCQLDLLAQAASVADAVASARTRPILTVSPTVDQRSDGTHLSIPPAAGYPTCEFFLPRGAGR